MEYDEMFTVLSMCFAPVGQDEWKQLVDGPLWSDFLDAARRGLQDDDALGEPDVYKRQLRHSACRWSPDRAPADSALHAAAPPSVARPGVALCR